MQFSQRLEEIKKDRRMTNKEIGELCGASEAAVRSWLSGSKVPAADRVATLADALGVSIDYLYGKEQKKRPAALHDKALNDLMNEIKDFGEEDMRRMIDQACLISAAKRNASKP